MLHLQQETGISSGCYKRHIHKNVGRLLTAAELLPVKRMDAASSKSSKGFLLTTGCDSHVFLQPL